MSVHPGGIKTNIARNARGGFNHGEGQRSRYRTNGAQLQDHTGRGCPNNIKWHQKRENPG